jgi:hypothetical protein
LLLKSDFSESCEFVLLEITDHDKDGNILLSWSKTLDSMLIVLSHLVEIMENSERSLSTPYAKRQAHFITYLIYGSRSDIHFCALNKKAMLLVRHKQIRPFD